MPESPPFQNNLIVTQHTFFITAQNWANIMIENRLTELALAYQRAFAGPPWFEKGKTSQGNFTSTPVGEWDEKAKEIITLEAYPLEELKKLFGQRVLQEDGILCIEEDNCSQNLTNYLFWPSSPTDLSDKKYPNNPEMKAFLNQNLLKEFVYLDELFASFARTKGNLGNFKKIYKQFKNLQK